MVLTIRVFAHVERTRRDCHVHQESLLDFVERLSERFARDLSMTGQHSTERQVRRKKSPTMDMEPPVMPPDTDLDISGDVRAWRPPNP